jgi:ParB family transcriptional regulator, chromosome partitioning protein
MSKKALGRGLSALFSQMGALEQDLIYLDIDQLDPTQSQPRHVFRQDKLEELAQSIKANGIIQPIVARRNGERFQIIAGERRWRAAQMAGLHKIPCIVKDIAEDNVLELSLIENIQREELNPIEEANAYKSLLERFGTTQEDIARRVGKDRSSITNSLRLLKLPPEVQKLVEEDKLSMGHARALLSLDSIEQQCSLAEDIISKSLSVRETERLIKKSQQTIPEERGTTELVATQSQEKIEEPDESANVAAAESKLSKRLAAPVRIKFHKAGGFIEIKFSSTEDLTRLFDLLNQRQAF